MSAGKHFAPLAEAYHEQRMQEWLSSAGEHLRSLFPTPRMAAEAFWRGREERALDIWHAGRKS